MNNWIIFYKKNCPYSQEALKILKNHKFKYTPIEITANKDEVISYLIKIKWLKKNQVNHTVPIIYYKKKYIGGCKELKQMNLKFTEIS